MNNKIWLSSPHMGGTELNYIHEAFEQNWVAPLGPNVNNFEEDLKKYLLSQKIRVIVILICTIIQSGVSIIIPYIYKILIDDVFPKKQVYDFYCCILILFVGFISNFLFSTAKDYKSKSIFKPSRNLRKAGFLAAILSNISRVLSTRSAGFCISSGFKANKIFTS